MATLYLIPVPLGPVSPTPACRPTPSRSHAGSTTSSSNAPKPRARTSRPWAIRCRSRRCNIEELNEHTPAAAIPALLAPLKAGHDVGLLSEAGCPAVADPGAALVMAAHREVLPSSR